jgi:hypothetical protein
MKKSRYPSVFSGYTKYIRGDYPINIHRKYIPTATILEFKTRIKLETEVLTYSASGEDTTYTLSATPARTPNVFVYLNGVRQEQPADYSVDGQDIVFTQPVPEGWSVIVTYSKM